MQTYEWTSQHVPVKEWKRASGLAQSYISTRSLVHFHLFTRTLSTCTGIRWDGAEIRSDMALYQTLFLYEWNSHCSFTRTPPLVHHSFTRTPTLVHHSFTRTSALLRYLFTRTPALVHHSVTRTTPTRSRVRFPLVQKPRWQ